ncbi:MAG: DUF2330 domain-containing protein [Polyangiaceae bacterium]
MKKITRLSAAALLAGAALLGTADRADAFCGFYVSGADTKLYNNATQVVLMRDGTRTVLSMQNNYQGPTSDFAMVVPVPVVLQKENVKTLTKEVFDHIDQLDSPRLVEYWEQDPCYEEPEREYDKMEDAMPAAMPMQEAAAPADYGVKIEAQFTVGEYDIVILSATDSTGLDRWLRDNQYKIPSGSEPLLRPYVEGGSKFFVAKVDAKKVTFKDGQAMLSPLRFHYDAESFSLPVRLGLVNSSGTQDLIVHILARSQRYDVANYKNVTIPTNLDVNEQAREQFGAFYAALFDRTVEENPKAVVTEYAWASMSCDPCPGPSLDVSELGVFGGDVIPSANQGMYDFVLTRLHARYGKDSLGDDLVFKTAKPIAGGREHMGQDGKLETGPQDDSYNNFQGRYAIRHPWKGAITCSNPRRGVWGGPPSGESGGGLKVARDLAFAPRGTLQLASVVQHDVPEISLKAAAPTVGHAGELPQGVALQGGGCGACRVGGSNEGPTLAAAIASLVAALAWLVRRRDKA